MCDLYIKNNILEQKRWNKAIPSFYVQTHSSSRKQTINQCGKTVMCITLENATLRYFPLSVCENLKDFSYGSNLIAFIDFLQSLVINILRIN